MAQEYTKDQLPGLDEVGLDDNEAFQFWTIEHEDGKKATPKLSVTDMASMQAWTQSLMNTEDCQPLHAAWTTPLALVNYTTAGRTTVDDLPDSVQNILLLPLFFLASRAVHFHHHLLDHSGAPGNAAERTIHVHTFNDGWLHAVWVSSLRHTCTKILIVFQCSDEASEMQMRTLLSWLLEAPLGLASQALFVDALMLRASLLKGALSIDRLHRALLDVQQKTGYHNYVGPNTGTEEDEIDLEATSKHICGVAVNMATDTADMQGLLRFSQFLQDVSRNPNSTPDEYACYISHELQALKSYAEILLEGSMASERMASIIVQTLLTLTTQRDQAIGIQIAQDSRTLAEKATRDSTSMKAIAAVTMCFLPATFVASLFAMPLFNWDLPLHQSVNQHFWVYWAVTLPLTAVVIGGWTVWLWYADGSSLSQRIKRTRFVADDSGKEHVSERRLDGSNMA